MAGVVPNPYSSYFLTGVSPRWYMNFWVDTGLLIIRILLFGFLRCFGIYLFISPLQTLRWSAEITMPVCILGDDDWVYRRCTGYLPFFPLFENNSSFRSDSCFRLYFGAAYAIARYRLMDIRFAFRQDAGLFF